MLFCVGPFLIWTWGKWIRAGAGIYPGGRVLASFGGLCLATLNAGLAVFLLVHALAAGGFPYYHPVELFCIEAGSLLSVLGLAASLVGTGRIRLNVAAISLACLLIWFMDAKSQ